MTTLVRQSRQNDDFGASKSSKLTTLVRQSRQNVAKVAALAHQSRQNREIGVPNLPFWGHFEVILGSLRGQIGCLWVTLAHLMIIL